MKKSRFYHTAPRAKVESIVNLLTNNVTLTNNIIKYYPRYTICGSYDYDSQILSFGIACCSGKDLFNKKIGRQISEGRALKNPFYICNVSKENLSKVFIETVKTLEYKLNNND